MHSSKAGYGYDGQPRERAFGSGDGSMNLCWAHVDLDGCMVVPGKVLLPPDDAGLFPDTVQSCIRLKLSRDAMTLTAARAVRDPATGFLVSEAMQPTITLPLPISAVVEDALKRCLASAVSADFTIERGAIEAQRRPEPGSASAKETRLRQPLSDWKLKIEEQESRQVFKISAALFVDDPKEGTIFLENNFWRVAEDGLPQRFQIEFAVNAATRIAVFGTWFPQFPSKPSFVPSFKYHDGKGSPRLGRALVSQGSHGTNYKLYGVLKGGGLISVWQPPERDVIAFEHCGRMPVNTHGFLHEKFNLPEERIWLYGMNLDRIMFTVQQNGRSGCIEISRTELGDIFAVGYTQFGIGPDGHHVFMRRAIVNFELAEAGLRLSCIFIHDVDGPDSYGRLPPATLIEEFTLGWELLILRFPALTKYLPRSIKQASGAGVSSVSEK